MKIVRDSIVVNTGIISQFIDKPLHIIRFVIYCLNILIHFLGRVRHTVHNSFHISLDGRNRSLQIMGYIAHQLPVLLLTLLIFLRILLQP